MASAPTFYDIATSIHTHTRYSDGGGDVADIVAAAQETKLDAVLIADHDHQRLRHLGAEGWYGNVLLLVGQEQGWKCDHVLVLGQDRELPCHWLNVRRHIQEAHRSGAMAFAAHPNGRRIWWLGTRDSGWTSGYIPGIHGLEVWCMMHDWIQNIRPWSLVKALREPAHFLSGPAPSTLRMWDDWSKKGRCVGIGSTDNHARPLWSGSKLSAVDYKLAFQSIRTHVLLASPLTGIAQTDRTHLYQMIRLGNVYVSRDDLCEAKGFSCWINNKTSIIPMGGEVSWTPGLILNVQSPIEADWTLIHDGQVEKSQCGQSLGWELNRPGVYRVEGRLEGKMWILGNPFRVGQMP